MAGEVSQDSEAQQGKILADLMNSGSATYNVQFIPFFKVLFKLIQIGLTKKNKMTLDRKQLTADKNSQDLNVQIESQ
jgi:hypothetical protein